MEVESGAGDSVVVVPGVPITNEPGYLRGHGSYVVAASGEGEDSGETGGHLLVASVAGHIERINKLISVRPYKSRYVGEVGDLVVGRITAVEAKRWKANISGHKDAVLQLSSVNLPGGVQRMRTHEDQLQMRSLFTENDLISAEIQNIGSDGTISLHTRSLKYGKLENGQLVTVPASLIKRLPQHYLSLPFGVDVIIGRNGHIWITRTTPDEWKAHEDADDLVPLAETLQALRLRHANTPLLPDERLKVARVRNSLLLLAAHDVLVSPESLLAVYQKSIELGLEPRELAGGSSLPAQLAAELLADARG